jgi:hypothetical protein
MTIRGQPSCFVVGFEGFFDLTRFMMSKASTEPLGGSIGHLFVYSPAILDLEAFDLLTFILFVFEGWGRILQV